MKKIKKDLIYIHEIAKEQRVKDLLKAVLVDIQLLINKESK